MRSKLVTKTAPCEIVRFVSLPRFEMKSGCMRASPFLGASRRLTTASSLLPRRVALYEVGPRDGLQNEATSLTTSQKLAFIDRLSAHRRIGRRSRRLCQPRARAADGRRVGNNALAPTRSRR